MDPEQADTATDAAAQFRAHVVPELPVLLRVARRLTGDAADAEDLVQETVMRAYRAINRFDGRHPRAWLLTILRNTWRNTHRRWRPRLVDMSETNVAASRDAEPGPDEQVLDGSWDAEVAAALEDLSRPQQEVIVLVDIDGLSYREAAGVLAVPEGTVMSRLHRGRKRLRVQLEAAGYGPTGRPE